MASLLAVSPRHLARDLALGVVVGIWSGAMGVGGGIIVIPILVLGLHMAQKRAQATSLVMVALAAVSGAIAYSMASRVAWPPVLVMVLGGFAGAFVGSSLVKRIPERPLQMLFGAFIIVVAVRLLFDHTPHVDSMHALPAMSVVPIMAYLATGLAMGVLSSLLGIGGGIIVIPILVTLFGYSQQLASGTSLAVMLPIALVGAYRQTKPGYTDWPMGLRLGVGAVVGAYAGARVALMLPGEFLRYLFAIMMILIGARMLWGALRRGRQVPAPMAEAALKLMEPEMPGTQVDGRTS